MIGNRRGGPDWPFPNEAVRPSPKFPDREAELTPEDTSGHKNVLELLHLMRHREERNRLFAQITGFRSRISTVIAPGSSLIDVPESLAPEEGFTWDVRRVTVNTFTGGTVTLFGSNMTSAADAEIVFQSAGSVTYGRGGLLVSNGLNERLVFQCNAVVGNVDIGVRGVLVPTAILAEYLT